MERMKRYEQTLRLWVADRIDLPGEADGFLPDPAWKEKKIGKRWYIGDDYHASIGQGFVTATPLQIANSIAAIANGGMLYTPHVLDGTEAMSRPVSVSADILRIVREGMRETVTRGQLSRLRSSQSRWQERQGRLSMARAT